jgi:phospholipase C
MADDPIEHVVVLMLENQSFDRLVGLTPGVNGVNPDALRSNPDQVTQKSILQNLSTHAHMDLIPRTIMTTSALRSKAQVRRVPGL